MKEFKSTILSQAHWQVAQADTQPKRAKELACTTHGLTRIKHETLTINIWHWADIAKFDSEYI